MSPISPQFAVLSGRTASLSKHVVSAYAICKHSRENKFPYETAVSFQSSVNSVVLFWGLFFYKSGKYLTAILKLNALNQFLFLFKIKLYSFICDPEE